VSIVATGNLISFSILGFKLLINSSNALSFAILSPSLADGSLNPQ